MEVNENSIFSWVKLATLHVFNSHMRLVTIVLDSIDCKIFPSLQRFYWTAWYILQFFHFWEPCLRLPEILSNPSFLSITINVLSFPITPPLFFNRLYILDYKWGESTEGSNIYTFCPYTYIQHFPLSTSPTNLMNLHWHIFSFIVYIRIYSWWYVFYGFCQMYNNMYLSLQYHKE